MLIWGFGCNKDLGFIEGVCGVGLSGNADLRFTVWGVY